MNSKVYKTILTLKLLSRDNTDLSAMLKTRILTQQLIAKQKNILLYNLCTRPGSDAANDEKEKELERIAKDASLDEPPTSCCQSGCANCVFIAWAEALAAKMTNASPEISEKILNMVEDPSMKAFLDMELRIRGLKK